MMILLLIVLFMPVNGWATTYWVNTTGGAASCTDVDGDADPGVYMTPTALDSANCPSAGDTVMFKAGTYTTTINWTNLLPNGTPSTSTKALCETHQACIIKSQPLSANTWAVVTFIGPSQYIQFGSRTQGFEVNGDNCTASQCKGILIRNELSTTNLSKVDVIGTLVRGQHSDGIVYSRNGTTNAAYVNITVEYNTIQQTTSPQYSAQGPPHGIYVHSNGGVIRHNDVTAPGDDTGGNTYGIHCYLPCNNMEIKYNLVRVPGPSRGIIASQGPTGGNVIERNVVKLVSGTSPYCIVFSGNTASSQANHNTCDGFTNYVFNQSTAGAGNSAKNNICTTTVSCSLLDQKADMTTAGNVTNVVAATTFVDAANANYALVAGSAQIDAGTVITGKPYNGSAPDRGAFETFTCAAGVVTGNTYDLQCSMALNTPLVVGLATGYTVNNTRNVSTVAISGSATARITFDGAACTGVQTWTATYNQSPGTATDSSMVGGSVNQPLWDLGPITATNNCAGIAYIFTQTTGGIYNAFGTQSSTSTITGVAPGAMCAVRTKFKATGADPPAVTTKLQYATDGENGTYTDVPDTFGAGNIRYVGTGSYTGMDDHNTSLSSERLTSEFSGIVSGAVIRCYSGCQTPSVDLSQDSETEQVDIVEFDTDALVGTIYHFRRVLEDGTVLSYGASSKPSVIIRNAGASIGH